MQSKEICLICLRREIANAERYSMTRVGNNRMSWYCARGTGPQEPRKNSRAEERRVRVMVGHE